MDAGGSATQEQLPRKQVQEGSPLMCRMHEYREAHGCARTAFWLLFFGEALNYRIVILHSEAARRVKAMDGFHEKK